ncbi:site-specific integrase [Trichlorobacter lovleyi]|uniref:Phage integrase family protein n=1 Tax=Trichlorobacter lovleyi (strain ATCC BAA-1151 / DSM 17278 / SZ) TaxID=398767 RepID=B3E8B5_TRIL1|nr:integrase domain-containing protein [Trichlorobacter lovleyi]ACD95152.1 phage integrase family protein [Trichlorobacter lovleyi SZ]
MPSFRSGRDQARHAVKQLADIGTSRHANRDDGRVRSLRTARNYEQALSGLTSWLQNNRLGSLRDLDRDTALRYLGERSEQVRQPTLDQDRQAIQALLSEKLPRVVSELSSALSGRAYTGEQLAAIAAAQTERHALATELAAACGLRAHELLTIRRIEEQQPSGHRTWRPDIHTGREGVLYVVSGKGGLRRTVMISANLADRLEARRLDQGLIVMDRGIRYKACYDIGGGQAWSSSFGSASRRVLGWSTGAHGCRHSYAQARMDELQSAGYRYKDALLTVSQEMGHFRASITEVYLR